MELRSGTGRKLPCPGAAGGGWPWPSRGAWLRTEGQRWQPGAGCAFGSWPARVALLLAPDEAGVRFGMRARAVRPPVCIPDPARLGTGKTFSFAIRRAFHPTTHPADCCMELRMQPLDAAVWQRYANRGGAPSAGPAPAPAEAGGCCGRRAAIVGARIPQCHGLSAGAVEGVHPALPSHPSSRQAAAGAVAATQPRMHLQAGWPSPRSPASVAAAPLREARLPE